MTSGGGDVCHTSRPGTPTRPGLAGGAVRLATPWRPVWETPAAPSRSGRGPCGVRPVALHSLCGRYAPCTRGARGGAAVWGGGVVPSAMAPGGCDPQGDPPPGSASSSLTVTAGGDGRGEMASLRPPAPVTQSGRPRAQAQAEVTEGRHLRRKQAEARDSWARKGPGGAAVREGAFAQQLVCGRESTGQTNEQRTDRLASSARGVFPLKHDSDAVTFLPSRLPCGKSDSGH